MIANRKICVVLPAYNAGRTLQATFRAIPTDVVDDVILVDDASTDDTLAVAKKLGIFAVAHGENRGYGGNQKTCYRLALERDADVIIMLHPDYQYNPKLLPAIASMLTSGLYDLVIGSRILGGTALAGGMPVHKYIANRALTLFQNFLLGHKLSEYHTGYRGFTRSVIETLPLERNSDDFVFDNQMLTQAIYKGFRVGEISCPTSYFPEASSISFRRSVIYALGVLRTSASFRLACLGFDRGTIFEGTRRAALAARRDAPESQHSAALAHP
jgi:glycosyltransferase involved in cell wall biosynthesis